METYQKQTPEQLEDSPVADAVPEITSLDDEINNRVELQRQNVDALANGRISEEEYKIRQDIQAGKEYLATEAQRKAAELAANGGKPLSLGQRLGAFVRRRG